ncbi:MAG TPA: carboxypeptidase M32 [Longimicrobiaceae bacterium]|nr:carboxypeptidase M32 [Longimicrobiaceae bacterium]
MATTETATATPRTGEASPYAELTRHLREAAVLASARATLAWDQETMMPPAGVALRAEQLSALTALAHERRTSPRVAELLVACEEDPELTGDPVTAANLREVRREYELITRLPTSLVRELAETSSQALEVWRDARERDDFPAFAPWLERIVRLNRAKAECYGVPEGGDLYDPLLDEYEPGMTSVEVERVFTSLRAGLAPLIEAIAESPRRPDPRIAKIAIPRQRQEELNRRVLERIGFDFGAGRMDVSTHPFCEGMGPGDTRLTTRYTEEGFLDSLVSCMHEAGHGMYEQGLPKAEHFGQPIAEAASLGIHESQSRMWENMVGRSRPFWDWALPEARRVFGATLDGVDGEEAYAFLNSVEPGLIRVEADEATYNLHVMLRFDLERAMLCGDLPVRDLPGAWNGRIRQDLGIEVPDDRRGCLQDIHWSLGAMAYFPTYTLGNLYSAQLWETIVAAVPELDDRMRAGDFAPLLGWLRENVHRHGRRFPAPELCERVTGRPLSPEPLLRYLEGKLRPLYGI